MAIGWLVGVGLPIVDHSNEAHHHGLTVVYIVVGNKLVSEEYESNNGIDVHYYQRQDSLINVNH